MAVMHLTNWGFLKHEIFNKVEKELDRKLTSDEENYVWLGARNVFGTKEFERLLQETANESRRRR
jgi:hypothetical protein